MEPMLAVTGSEIVWLILGLVVGTAATCGVIFWLGRSRLEARRREAESITADAQRTSEQLIHDARVQAKEELLKMQEQFKAESAETRTELREIEKRLTKREDSLEAKLDTLNTKERKIDQQEKQMIERARQVEQKEEQAQQLVDAQREKLTQISGMSMEIAQQTLLSNLEQEMSQECGQLIDKMINDAREHAEEKSREILITAIQRYAAAHTSSSTVRTVDIPSDEMKGRVIGREGRNIRAFEKATGVDVIVDDTPGVVVVSSFDPVRSEVARLSLEKLIQDGRIHPARIEEVVEETRQQVEKQILDWGNKASMEANVGKLHKKQIDLLGRLHYRTSYGQNVLDHSVEVAYLCQVIADELGLDGALARRCGLLHDIGKAVDHEVEGGHPQIGADICKRFNERPEVLNAIAGHHGDIPSISPYTPIVTAADAISASRPGSRRESLEHYIKRLEQLESLASSFQGVRQAYAIQAGREVRVIVDANRVDDGTAMKFARDIAKRIEEEMTYPGEIRVTVLREIRAVEYAR
ncbi:MAG: Ribonuclease Y [Phycisphaerae bacterium]|nr:Ribonuclease Y [Phycisphaerae bacterium]